MKLNDTLLRHLPEKLQTPKDNFEARPLAFRAERNVRKRAELNHPEDVLDAPRLIAVVNDMLQYSMDGSPSPAKPGTWFGGHAGQRLFDEENLLWQVRHGLVVPRYVIRNYDKDGSPRGPISGIIPAPQLVFNAAGQLQKVNIQTPRTGDCHRLGWYKKQGFLIEHPDVETMLAMWPRPLTRKSPRVKDEILFLGSIAKGIVLFTFKQALHALGVHQLMYTRIDWLSMSPAIYQRQREFMLQSVENLLRDEGIPPPRFCQNPDCRAILPAIGHRKFYCSEPCKDAMKKVRKSSRRSKKNGALLEPFAPYDEPLSLPPIE